MNVDWSHSAEEAFLETISNLLLSSPNSAEALLTKVEELQELIKVNHYICPQTKYIHVRKCVVLKHYGLIYVIQKNIIEVQAFFSNRTDHPFYENPY